MRAKKIAIARKGMGCIVAGNETEWEWIVGKDVGL